MDNKSIQEALKNNFLRNIRESNKCFTVKSQGSSMLPLIRPGAELTIKGCLIEDLEVGDLIAFHDKDAVSVHRCIFRNREVFYERGDNCSLWVSLIPKKKENLIGKVVSIKDEDNRVLNVANNNEYKIYTKLVVKVGILSAIVGKLLKVHQDDMDHKEISTSGIFSRLIYKKINKTFNYLRIISDE